MRTKLLFSAIALSAAFVACNNEDLQDNLANDEALVGNEVVGANLVSKGMGVTLGDAVSSRVNSEGWEGSDKIAMGWYDYTGDDIAQEFSKEVWGEGNFSTNDPKVYANHLFTYNKETGEFVTNSNIYEGAHFMYFPYIYQPKVAQLEFVINGPQTTEFASDHLNNALHISAQDFISADAENGDVDTENGYLSKSFVMTPAVNVIGVTATPEDNIKNQEFLKTLEVSELRMYAAGANFVKEAYVVPGNIPAVVRDENGNIVKNGTAEKPGTIEELDNAFKANGGVFVAKQQDSNPWLVTEIDADFTLEKANILRSFVLPIEGLQTAATDAAVRINVEKEGYFMGQFQVSNTAALKKLKEIVSTGGSNGVTLSKINRKDGNWSPIGLPVEMLISDFTPDAVIDDLDEWNYTVALYDALNSFIEDETKKIVPVFELNNDITFNGGEIKTPAAGVKVEPGKKLIIDSDVVWPSNLVGNRHVDNDKNLTVLVKDVTVEVNANANKNIDFNLSEGSVINMNEVASEIKLANDAEGSRININKYGAKVELSSLIANGLENTVVAYNLPKGYKNYEVNNLMALNGEGRRFALVNTFVIGKGVAFELDREDAKSSTNDPYTGEDVNIPAQKVNADLIKNVDIEMNGGTIKNGEVADITALAGTTSTAIDVESKSITLEENAKLTITTDDELNEGDPMTEVTTGVLTIGKDATVTADNVIVNYTEWNNAGTSAVKNNGKFQKKK